MYISQRELKKYNINLDITDLENGLVQLGHEVEAIDTYQTDKIVVGLVKSVEKHPEADRLNVTKVDIGTEELQIVCGAPNVAEGQLVPVAVVGAKFGDFKIKKAKLRGVESQGMICSIAEMGLDKSVLTEEDQAGIYVYEEAEIGQNAFEALTLTDNVLELGLTANRGDCQSYIGVLRDLLALNNQKLEIETSKVSGEFDSEFKIANQDPTSLRLAAIEIQNVKAAKSPAWLKIFLAKHKIKTQNVLVDLTNYVLLQTGVPMHAYDADQIKGGIRAMRLEGAYKFTALDEVEYELSMNDLVIADDEKVVSIASVMGSNATKVTDNTNRLLVEIGVFNPTAVRKSATSISRKTDASMRGEKGIDYNQVNNAFNLFVSLLRNIQTDIKVSNLIDTNELEMGSDHISLKFNSVNRILGITVAREEVIKILNNLHFETVELTDEEITVSIPSWRFDIFNDHDLIEEVIRIVGMEKVEVTDILNTFVTKTPIINDPKIQIERELELIGLDQGLNQVVTYSLVNSETLDTFNQKRDAEVCLMMPLSNEHASYRQSLIPSLMDVAQYNFARQAKQVNIFEIANTYYNDGEELIEEYFMSGLVSGQKADYYANEKVNYDFFDLKAVVEAVLNNYNLNYEIVKSTVAINELNPYAHADILVDGEYIGFIGKTHPNYFAKMKRDIFVFEINLKKIEAKLVKAIDYKITTSLPSIERDVTIDSKVEATYAELTKGFANINFLSNINLKDIYAGDKIEAGTKATTFTLTFTPTNETLTGEMIDQEFEKIYKQTTANGFVIKR